LPTVRILDERVERYIHELQPARSEVMAEMEAVADRDGVPIVDWETGRFLAVLCRSLDPVVLEVGPRSATRRCTWRSSSAPAA
jgi:predicted O-methyltransferase YrrM